MGNKDDDSKRTQRRVLFVTDALVTAVQPAGACACYMLSSGRRHTVAMSVNDSRINLHNVQHATRLHLQDRKVKLTLQNIDTNLNYNKRCSSYRFVSVKIR
jgi:hypothetical protein